MASRRLERQRGAAIRSLRIRRASIRSEPKDWRCALRIITEFADSCFVRSRFPDAGDGKFAFGQLARIEFHRSGCAASASAAGESELLRGWNHEIVFWEFTAGRQRIP